MLARAQSTYQYRYWFDEDDSQAVTIESGDWLKVDIELDGLQETLHTLHVQVTDTEGVSSSPKTVLFLKTPSIAELADEVCYWFDSDSTMRHKLEGASVAADIDVSQLEDGVHVLHIQSAGANPSVPQSMLFLKVPQTIGLESLRVVTSIDGRICKQEDVAANKGLLHYDFDVTGLDEGVHLLNAQVVTASGNASSVCNSYFLRMNTTEELSRMKCFYAIDDQEGYSVAGTLSNGAYHFDVNVANLTDGLHRIAYAMMTESGMMTNMRSAFFMKTPLGGNGIVAYEYWVNKDEDSRNMVKLDDKYSPFNLTALLPVPSEPLRSSQFHFEFNKADGKPMIYANNDIHLRFHEASGRFADESAQYIDYSVSQEVTDAEPLVSGKPMVKNKPADNEIQWYHFPAQIGDSLTFKVDRACTIQVFDPTGEEVYSASGSEVVRWGGCHAWEDGEYYLALHDVTAQQGTTTKLEYQHIDKYVVLSHTPDVIGAAHGYFHVTLFGNGYDKLIGASLENNNAELAALTFNVTDISHASLEFYHPSEPLPLGEYDLVLRFNDDGEEKMLTVRKAITVSEAIYGDIEIVMNSLPSVAKPYPVTITVRNTGNVEYQSIPLFIAWNNLDGIHEVHLMNLELDGHDNIDECLIHTDDLLGRGITGDVLPIMIPSLKGYESQDIVMGYVTDPHHLFTVYTWTYQPLTLDSDTYAVNTLTRSKSRSTMKKVNCPMSNPDDFSPDAMNCINNIRVSAFERFAYTISDIIARHCHLNGDEIMNLSKYMNNKASDKCPNPGSHNVNPFMPGDPNEMHGYMSEANVPFIREDVKDVYYRIEFENDPEIANAAAHHIVITDQLDGTKLDLASFKPTSVMFGSTNVVLDGKEQSFIKTVDMRPEVNALGQVSLDYNTQTGLATWDIVSLDPMTMEPTDDAMMGILSVGGIGEVTFDISLKTGLKDGETIDNKATIVFDQEGAIETPVFTNIMDFTAPSSRIRDSRVDGDSITLYFEGRDSGSGVWKYDVYQLAGDAEKWRMVAEGVTADSCRVRYYEGFDYNFSVIATDKAGNVEDKELSVLPELDCDLQLKAGWNWVSTFLNSPQPVAEMFDKGVNRVMSQTHESIKDPVFGVVGQIMSMQPGVGYKVSSEADFTVSYMGRLHNLAESPIEVKKGWNWIAYPYHESREIGMAIVNADEDDLISSQRGYAEFADGTWEGSISSLEAGLGYLYRSATDKTLAFDFQTPSPMAKAASADGLRPDTESGVDPHKYPSTMNVTARLYRDGAAITDSHYVVYAMSDDELRGEGRCVNGTHYITVYGDQPVEISFVIEDTDTGDTYEACETVTFTSDAVGSRKSPFTLTFGEATSIAGVESEPNAATHTVSGIKVERIDKPGIYIRNGKKISVPARQQ